jgi:hypothetical protein
MTASPGKGQTNWLAGGIAGRPESIAGITVEVEACTVVSGEKGGCPSSLPA